MIFKSILLDGSTGLGYHPPFHHEQLERPMPVRIAALGMAALVAACVQVPVNPPESKPAAETALADAAPQAAPVVVQQEPAESVPVQATAPVEQPAAAIESQPQDLWHRVRTGFRLPDTDGRVVEHWEQWYSSNPDYVARMVDRSSLFLYYVMEEVERRNMPAEIALLPMIESAYNPQAYSHAHASGIWQFISSTGRIYGLRQNYWYDGRRDVLAATSAALDYLEKLYAEFGSWDLAFAAYNSGEGAVRRAIARNQASGRSTAYKNLALPLETRRYVPKLQAVKNIVANPERYGLQLAGIPNRPYFATVITSHHIDVKLAAILAEMPEEEFRLLNPAHNKPVIRSDGSETIVLPSDKVEIFQRNLEAHDQPFVSWQTYTVKRSDRPEKIAAMHGITLAELKEANGITGTKKINPGQILVVPSSDNANPHLPDLPAPKITRTRYKPKNGKAVQVRNKTVAGDRLAQREAGNGKPSATNGKSAKRADVTAQKQTGTDVVAARVSMEFIEPITE
jgi:membrane-bound lytic murein transglycosylase D